MPPFGSVYTAEEILDAGAYCATFAENLAGSFAHAGRLEMRFWPRGNS